MSAARQTNRFSRTRTDHATEVAEDYTELIAELMEEKGEARVGDMAEALGVTHVAVSRMLGKLRVAGLVQGDRRKPITLTEEGRAMAVRAKRRHEIVVAFLRSIGVPEAQAEADAEGIEHHCSPATLRAMEGALREGRG
ncbi:MAG: manganese-binding transcriptional regulator MntR [Phycisphaerales bacterium]